MDGLVGVLAAGVAGGAGGEVGQFGLRHVELTYLGHWQHSVV